MDPITSTWGYLEPFLAIYNYVTNRMPHSRLSTSQFLDSIEKAFDDIISYVESYGINKNEFAPANKNVYIRNAHIHFGFKNGEYTKVIEGKPEAFFLKQFDLPKKNRFNIFLLDSYLLSKYYKHYFSYRNAMEKWCNFSSKKKTSLHYMSISNWRNRNYEELISEVEKIKKIDTKPYEFYKFNSGKLKEDSKIASLLDSVLSKGVISNKTLFQLASSEKLIIVHKYAEGFSEPYRLQNIQREQLTGEISRMRNRATIGRRSLDRISQLDEALNDLNTNWITAPIGRALKNYGFKKLFSKNEGIYFLPLSLIPAKYGNDHKLFIKEEIIKNAEDYYDSIIDSPFLIEERQGLNFIILSHVIRVDQIDVIDRNRSLSVSTPHLAKMLMSRYFLSSDDDTAEIYINDVVRNVDFLSRIDSTTKTGVYLRKNFQNLKNILWNIFRIDIHKPVLLSSLSENDVIQITNRLIELDDTEIQAFRLKKLLAEQVNFYSELKKELDEIKSDSK